MHASIDMLMNKYAIALARAKRRPIKMVTISEDPSNQDIFIAEILVSRLCARFYFVFGSEILLKKKFSTTVASCNYFRVVKKIIF